MHTGWGGFWTLEATGEFRVRTRNGSNAVVAPDAAPTYRIYVGASVTAALTGTTTGTVDSQTGYYRVAPALTAANGFTTDAICRIEFTWAVSSTSFGETQIFQIT